MLRSAGEPAPARERWLNNISREVKRTTAYLYLIGKFFGHRVSLSPAA
jgi:hypothetical protein